MDNAIRVSIAELLEVRADGLYTPELLSIIVGACEHLQRIDKSGVFNVDYIFFAPNGKIEITLVSAAHLAEENLPPELRDHIDEDDRLRVREPQIVWCLGSSIQQSCARACSDAELFSLVNLMTVSHVGTRPTLTKLGQMARNRCAAAGIDVHGVLKALYEELMGDIDELVDDATSLSGWSEVNGHGSKDQKHESPPSPSSSHSEEDDDGNETDDATMGYRNYLHPVAEEDNNYKQATKISRRDSDESTTTAMTLSSDEKDESRKGSMTSEAATLQTASESSDGEKTPPAKRKSPSPEEFERAITPIAEESETPSPRESPILKRTEEKETTIVQKEPRSQELPQSPFIAEQSQSPFISIKKASASPPSLRNVLPSKISEEDCDIDEMDLPLPRDGGSPKMLQKPSLHTVAGVVSARKKSTAISTGSSTPIQPQKGIPETLPAQVQPRQVPEEIGGQLSRHNSLGPSKVHRRSSRARGNFATPEFVEKQSLAVIRLQAQSSRKKRLSLTRIETTFVLVKIVNGQTVEVNCRSDAYVGSVFDSVVEYFNVPEHTFFGLAVIRDSEYFFLDNEQRLEKYAPPGWKNPKKGNQERYMLYLRFRYYPKKLEFIKTPTTTHSLYLQLRQDILYDSLKPKRDKLFELAALALQAEFGEKPTFIAKMGPKVPYFQLQHYLPPRASVDQETARVENSLSEIHSHYSGQSTVHSEKQFIELCQNESDYGAHYYRVYKFKPSSTSPNTNQMNDVFKVAILPDGLGICSQQGTLQSAHTKITTFHPWHMIRTLQFDRKRFLIATIENNIAQDHVFYTDHYTKSSYLVRFAASQHKFMMKMRHWQFTLSRDRPGINKDIGIERNSEIEAQEKEASEQPFAFATMPKRNIPEKQPIVSETRSEETPRRGTQGSTLPSQQNPFEENDNDQNNDEGPQRVQIKIILEKDPSTGLGLTLVDGAVEDIKGVYVKSVSTDGDAKKKGVEKGDCIQAINGISLVDKTRHDAVELVKQSGREVGLDIMRFPCITQILGHERQASKEEPLIINGTTNNGFQKRLPSKDELLVGKRPSLSRTPPANRKITPSNKNVRQRAASDFGALGDALPVLKSEDLLAGFEKARRRTRSNSGSDESDGEVQKGEYRLPVTSIYNFHASEDENEDDGKPSHQENNGSTNYPMDDTTSWVSKSTIEAQKSVQSYPHRQNLDWTNELSDIEDSPNNNEGSDMQRLQISIQRLGKTLGFQVASGGGFVFVKAVTSDPALSAGLQVDDRIVAINGRPTAGMNHQNVVDLLRMDRSPIIQLSIDRMNPPIEKELTILVSLEKSHNTSLGLSLAKRMGREGIYIRNIAAGSIADKDGRLKQGDKIWEVDGENVADESANSIVEKLKMIEGRLVEIVVKRAVE